MHKKHTKYYASFLVFEVNAVTMNKTRHFGFLKWMKSLWIKRFNSSDNTHSLCFFFFFLKNKNLLMAISIFKYHTFIILMHWTIISINKALHISCTVYTKAEGTTHKKINNMLTCYSFRKSMNVSNYCKTMTHNVRKELKRVKKECRDLKKTQKTYIKFFFYIRAHLNYLSTKLSFYLYIPVALNTHTSNFTIITCKF